MTPHPCMTDFLVQFVSNPRVSVPYYNGDHIIVCHPFKDMRELKEQGYIQLHEYGQAHLLKSFDKMTVLEKAVLATYFAYVRTLNVEPVIEQPLSSFDQMTEWEKETLKDYFKRYENKN